MKLVFINSVNVEGKRPAFDPPFYLTPRAELKFQKGMKAEMGAEWEVDFVSADLNSEEPVEDIAAVRQSLAPYLNQERYAKLVILPDSDFVVQNYPAIKRKILNALIK